MLALTPKQARFAREYVKLSNASEAYRSVYDAAGMSRNATHVEACRLKANPKVALVVDRLMSEVTQASVTAHLEEIRGKACADKQYGPAVSAVMGMAKVARLVDDVRSFPPPQQLNVQVNLVMPDILALRQSIDAQLDPAAVHTSISGAAQVDNADGAVRDELSD